MIAHQASESDAFITFILTRLNAGSVVLTRVAAYIYSLREDGYTMLQAYNDCLYVYSGERVLQSWRVLYYYY